MPDTNSLDPQSIINSALSSDTPTPKVAPPTPPLTPPNSPIPEPTPSTPPITPAPPVPNDTVPHATVSQQSIPTPPPIPLADDTPLAFITPSPVPNDTVPHATVSQQSIPTPPKPRTKLPLLILAIFTTLALSAGGFFGYRYYTSRSQTPQIASNENTAGLTRAQINAREKAKISVDTAIKQRERTGTCKGADCVPDYVAQMLKNDPSPDKYLSKINSDSDDNYAENIEKVIQALFATGQLTNLNIKDIDGNLITQANAIKALIDDCGADCKDTQSYNSGTREFLSYLQEKNVSYFWQYLNTLGNDAPTAYCRYISGDNSANYSNGKCMIGTDPYITTTNIHYPANYAMVLDVCKDKTGSDKTGSYASENNKGARDQIVCKSSGKDIPGGAYNAIDCRIDPTTGKHAGAATFDFCAGEVDPLKDLCADLINSDAVKTVYKSDYMGGQHEDAYGTFVGCQTQDDGVTIFNCHCQAGDTKPYCHQDAGSDSCNNLFIAGVATPTPNPTSPPSSSSSLSCSSLTSNVTTPTLGTPITFTCNGTISPATNLTYSFRYSVNSGAFSSLANVTANTASLTPTLCGSYTVECRACGTIDGSTVCDPTWIGATTQ